MPPLDDVLQPPLLTADLPGIGDSAIPADGIDMKTSASRIHALVRSLEGDAYSAGHERCR